MTDSDYDIFGLISTLAAIANKYPAGSTEQEAIERAQVALLYVHERRKEDDLNGYYREQLDPNYKIPIAREFSTREEAEAWMKSGGAEHAMFIQIAGSRFQVAELPGGRWFLIDRPVPKELEKSSDP